MNKLNYLKLRRSFGVIGIVTLIFISQACAQEAAMQYFNLLSEGLTSSRDQLSTMTAAAEKAAEGYVQGGNIFVFSHQPDFSAEATGRAGGLMCIKRLGSNQIKKGDVILFGVCGKLTAADRAMIQKWRDAGAYVVTFGAGLDKNEPSNAQADFTSVKMPGLAVTWNDKPAICPADVVMNAVNLWAFTGEFVSACTRRGKMPVLYQSYGMPGGRARGKKYLGQKFHTDMQIQPVEAGLLGKAYLDAIEKYLKQICDNEISKIASSAESMRASAKKQLPLVLTMGHMFPAQFLDPRSPQGFEAKATTDQAEPDLPGQAGRYVLFVGYQQAPEKLVKAAGLKKMPLTYMSVRQVKQPAVECSPLYINPYWPIEDSCVSVPGYDVPILPASGVVDAAIYWAIRAEECR